jgi:hypothetical protein
MVKSLVLWMVVVLSVAGCRRIDPLDAQSVGEELPSTLPFNQRLSFTWSGVPAPQRTYTNLRSWYDAVNNVITVETLGDPASQGKFFLQVRGNRSGIYSYDVQGGPSDVNEVYMSFIPSFTNHTADAVFTLTGQPQDSLEAEVEIRYFGAVRDSITGTFSGRLKITHASGNAEILIQAGRFIAVRQ